MSFLEDLINEIDQTKQPKKESKPNKFLEFEKQLRDLAKSKGVQPRTFLEQLVKHKPELANNRIIQKLIGEQDVPTQKGRDAKPEVLTKRAMNTVKKGIKQAANKQRRRMDKDAVEEDVKDQFTKLINPMGQDSRSLEKIKQSPGFHQLIISMFASGTQADMDWDEIFSAMSKMLNMNPIEIKAILQQDGMDFSEPDAAERFKQNMGATGFLGKGKSRTVNSVYEGSLDQFRNLYRKSIGSDDAAVTLRELINVINDDSLWADEFPQLKQFTGISQHSGSRIVTAKKIPGDSADEKIATLVKAIDDDEWVNDTAKHLMRSFTLGEDAEQDTQYAKMIIQQNPQEYKKFMDTGDLMDAPTIYEKLFAYFSSSDADDQMPYGTQKARDGDPYVWLTDKLDELGLTEGNEFAQKVRQLKATGAKKGTKFKTSDGEEHTLEDERYDSDSSGKFQITFSDEDMDANTEAQYLQVLKNLLKTYKGVDIARVDDVESYIMVRGLPEQKTEAVSDKTIDSFHTELDQLVHKYFGHSSDEKREKVNNESNYQRGGVRVNPQQALQAKVTGTVTRVSGDMVTIRNDRTNKTYDIDTRKTNIVPQVDMRGQPIDGAPLVIQHQGSSHNINPSKIGQRSAMSGGVRVGDKIKLESIVESKAITEQEFDEAAGKKDACYHKVKARYKVWPSAYASGALVQCRKKGAANWGNKSD